MSSQSGKYMNPRIDGSQVEASAARGVVHLDAAKFTWTSSMILIGTVGSAVTISAGAVAIFLVSTIVTLCLGHSLGMHRRFIHRSYRCPKWIEYLFVHLGVLVGLAGPFGMLTTHDTRDWAQRQPTCHDYFSHGQVWYRDLWWQLFCSFEFERAPDIRIESAVADDRVYRWMERTWMLQQLPWALLFYYIGGWGWVFWGICSRVSISVFGHWAIGYFAHNKGHRDWHVADAAAQGYNIPWAALITMGESWHNNHHAFPGSAKLGIKAGQWDPGWWVLLAMQKLGIAADLETSETLPPRADLLPVANHGQLQR